MINTGRISKETQMDLAQAAYNAARKFFEDPKNIEAFEAWKKRKESENETD